MTEQVLAPLVPDEFVVVTNYEPWLTLRGLGSSSTQRAGIAGRADDATAGAALRLRFEDHLRPQDTE